MNTATSIREMDAETIAHEVIACNKSSAVMGMILAHFGLELEASETDPFKMKAKPATRIAGGGCAPDVIVPHCDECGGPDIYHSLGCSVVEMSFRDVRDEQ